MQKKIVRKSKLQVQYDKIYSYFRTTTEPFDSLGWDGKILEVWDGDAILEIYSRHDLHLMPRSSKKAFPEFPRRRA